MPSVNDVLMAFLEGVTGLTGLTLNDQLARLADLNYIMPPRTVADPANPPLGATWINTTEGKMKTMTAAGVQYVTTAP